jgi:hypothetical protein
MAAILALLFLAVSIKQDATPLRDGCGADAQTIVQLPAGTEVTIRFALSGESTPCYKIAATIEGKELAGYVPATDLDGLDGFQQSVREAPPAVDVRQLMATVRPVTARVTPATPDQLIVATESLLDAGQPERALALIEPEARNARDPSLLTLAGAAAWRADDAGKALGYWRQALDLQPNPALETVYRRVEKENSNDHSSARLFGVHVTLRYEASAIGADTAREMVGALDQEFARVSDELGCTPTERVVAIAQSPEAYRKTTDAAEWSGGQFDGRIRVPVAQGQVMDPALYRALAHEITHACVTLTGKWPAWLQEGLAQKLSGDRVSPQLHAKIAAWTQGHKLPRLTNLGQDWSRMDTEHAQAAYGLSLEAVDLLYETKGVDGIRNLLRNPDRLAEISAELDKRLGL